MPKGTTAPGNVWPSPAVPMNGSTAAKAAAASAAPAAGASALSPSASAPRRSREAEMPVRGGVTMFVCALPYACWIGYCAAIIAAHVAPCGAPTAEHAFHANAGGAL